MANPEVMITWGGPPPAGIASWAVMAVAQRTSTGGIPVVPAGVQLSSPALDVKANLPTEVITTANYSVIPGNFQADTVSAAGITGAAAASRYVGATASGAPASGTFAAGDFVIDQTAAIWICTAAGTPGTWAKSGSGVVIDGTASDIQPDGIRAAGGTGKAADGGHIHQENAWQSLLAAPTGAAAETFPRLMCNATLTISSTTARWSPVALPKGLAVSNVTVVVGSQAEAGGTHGWIALVDSGFVVRAVSADQTGATTFAPPSTAVTLAMATPYTTPSAALYYIVMSVTASTTLPNFVGFSASPTTAINLAPQLNGISSSGTTPPSTGTNLGAPTASASTNFYAYVT